MNHSKCWLVTSVAIVVLAVSAGITNRANGDEKGHGHGGQGNGGHNHGGGGFGGGGQNFIGVSPLGLTYGYQNRNFGIQIGPVGGNQGYYNTQPFYAQPNYQPAYYQYDPGYSNYSSPGMMNGYGYSGVDPNFPPGGYPPNGTIITNSQPLNSGVRPASANGSINAGNQPAPANNSNLKSVLNNSTTNPKFAENLVSNPESRGYYLQSLQLFSSGDYKNASRVALHAMLEDPGNGQLKLYISQCQLANGDYEAAAAHLYDGLSRLEQEQWGGVVENFRQFYKQNDYVPQFDKLVKFAQENPDAAYAYSLRGYHYFYLGHPEAAEKQWTKALEIDSKEPLAIKLKVLTDGATAPTDPTLAAPLPSPNK